MTTDVYAIDNDREAYPWMVDAPCIGSKVHYPEGTAQARRAQIQEAKRICATCPLTKQDKCHEYAEVNDERWGVWASVHRGRDDQGTKQPKGVIAARRAAFIASLPAYRREARRAAREAAEAVAS